MSQSKLLSLDHFMDVLSKAYEQVASGKGKARHGISKEFEDQPWKLISDTVGPEFLIGQAIKKLMELKAHKIHMNKIEISGATDTGSRDKWMADALGAIVYTAMAVMYEEYTNHEEEDKKAISFGKFTDD